MYSMTGFSAQAFTRLKGVSKVLFSLEAQGHLPRSCGCGSIQFFVVVGLRLPFPVGCSQLLMAACIPCHMPPTIFKVSMC